MIPSLRGETLTETAFRTLVPINEPSDAKPMSEMPQHNQDIEQTSYDETRRLISGADIPAFAMRGAIRAIAEEYRGQYLERGLGIILRGVRNAFAEVRESEK